MIAPRFSLVVPCFNEEAVLPLLRSRLTECLASLGAAWEVILIDDGSRDGTFALLAEMHRIDPRFKVICLSRNFGQQAAICAGLSKAAGMAVGVMDADLQDPPELLPRFLEKVEKGVDVVYAIRRKRNEGLFKRAAYRAFYRLLNALSDVHIPLDSGDFCVMSRRVVDTLMQMRESNLFLRGMRAWAGFRQEGVAYERDERAAGSSKYSFKRLVSLAADGILSFSLAPLRLATYLGLCVVVVSLLDGLFTVIWRLAGFRFMGHNAQELPGWATLAAGMMFLHGVELLILGVIGEYLGRIYTQNKQRPRYIIREELGFR